MVSLVINSLSLWQGTNYTAECGGNLPQGRQDIRPGPTRTSWMQAGPTLKPSEDAPASERSTRRGWPRLRTEPAEGRRRSRRARGDVACDCSRSGSPGLGCEDGMTFLNGSVEAGFQHPRETEPTRALPFVRLVVSTVNRSTLTRVSARSEISATVLTSHGREITA